MKQYRDLLAKILSDGEDRGDRTGVGTRSIFGGQIEFDLRERFPLVTIKKTLWKSSIIEMLWFLSGKCDNLDYLHKHNVPIWDDWAKDGRLGPIYGVQWRRWMSYDFSKPGYSMQQPIDQIAELIYKLKNKPTDRRLIVSGWNVADINKMALPPCHRDFQCYVTNDGHLDLMMAIRSWDTVLGGPFNICQYAALTHMLAQVSGLKPRMLKINYGDAHVYQNHIPGVQELLQREEINCPTKLEINPDIKNIDDFTIEHFNVTGYESHPFMKFDIAV
jgi:thymidylate synthase